MSDSAQARFTTFEVPGLMMTPLPSGAITAGDRSQLDDIYAGILAVAPVASNQTCWTNSQRGSSAWVNSNKSTNTWSKEQANSKVWTSEKEVIPC